MKKLRTIYFDCFAGASGDMIVAALLDLGLDLDFLRNSLKCIDIGNYMIQAERVQKASLAAMKFSVLLGDVTQPVLADSQFIESANKSDQFDIPTAPEQHATSHNSLEEILHIIKQSTLSDYVKENASRIFTRLGEAEAHVHGVPIEEIHFHEVGAVDAIVDVISTCIGLEFLEIDQIVVSPIHLGTGTIHSAHGILPIPAPATAELVKNIPVYTTDIKGELLTPTGAAILTSMAHSYGPMPLMAIKAIGYGAGHRDRDFPNVLRAFLGECDPSNSPFPYIGRNPFPEQHETPLELGGYHNSPAVILETNIDDMSPQLFGNLMQQLLDAGALDITYTPIQMKKNRPGIKVQVLCSPETVDLFLTILFRETTTLGVRSYPVTKHMLQRDFVEVNIKYGTVHVKVARLGEKIVNIVPEYEECQNLAKKYHVPVKEIINQAIAACQLLQQ